MTPFDTVMRKIILHHRGLLLAVQLPRCADPIFSSVLISSTRNRSLVPTVRLANVYWCVSSHNKIKPPQLRTSLALYLPLISQAPVLLSFLPHPPDILLFLFGRFLKTHSLPLALCTSCSTWSACSPDVGVINSLSFESPFEFKRKLLALKIASFLVAFLSVQTVPIQPLCSLLFTVA